VGAVFDSWDGLFDRLDELGLLDLVDEVMDDLPDDDYSDSYDV